MSVPMEFTNVENHTMRIETVPNIFIVNLIHGGDGKFGIITKMNNRSDIWRQPNLSITPFLIVDTDFLKKDCQKSM